MISLIQVRIIKMIKSNLKEFTCYCGSKLTRRNETRVCLACGSRYLRDGRILVSRHNWNVIDFFETFQRKQSNHFVKHQN